MRPARWILAASALLVACSSTTKVTTPGPTTVASGAATAPTATTGTTATAPTVPLTTVAPTTTTTLPAPTTVPPTTAARARTIADLLASTRPIVLAHGGGDDAHPHSTPFAFAESVNDRVDMLDMDVQLTGDGVLVVQHDDTVDHYSSGTGKVKSLTYDQIHALDNAYWFTATCSCKGQPDAAYVLRGIRTGQKPPPAGYTPDDFAITRFRDIATRFAAMPLNIEIKGSYPADVANAQALAKELRELGRLQSVVVTSFDDKLLDAFHQLAPEVELTPGLTATAAFVLSKTPLPAGMRILQLPPSFNNVDVLTPDVYARAKAAGYPIWVWPNDSKLENETSYKRYLADGVKGLNAAQPAQAVAAVFAGYG